MAAVFVLSGPALGAVCPGAEQLGVLAKGIKAPTWAVAGNNGDIHISSEWNTVETYAHDGQHLRSMAHNAPLGLAVDSGGALFVTSAENTLTMYSPAREVLKTIATGMVYPSGLAVTKDRVYVSSAYSSEIKAYDKSGGYLFSLDAQGQFLTPISLFADKTTGELYALNQSPAGIFKFDKDGILVSSLYSDFIQKSGVLIAPRDIVVETLGTTTVNKTGYTPDLCEGGVATASSANGGDVAGKAFDNDEGSLWQSYRRARFPHWIKYDMGAGGAKVVNRLRLKPDAGYVKDFVLQGSNDNASWTDLYSGTAGSNPIWYEWDFANTANYRYYRLRVDSNYISRPYVKINEIELIEGYVINETIQDKRIYVSDAVTGKVHVFDGNCKGNCTPVCDLLPGAVQRPFGITMGKGNVLYVVDKDGGALHGIGIDDYVKMKVSPKALNFKASACEQGSQGKSITISNEGPGLLAWEVSSDSPWIQMLPTTGGLSGIGSAAVSVNMDASPIGEGLHQGTITVKSSDATDSVLVSVEVLPPPPLLQ